MAESTRGTPKKERERLQRERAEAEEQERAQKQARFLLAFRESANVRAACLAAGIGRRTVYTWRDEYPAFAAQWTEAEAEAVDVLEAHAWSRATRGTTREHSIFYQGERVGKDVVTEYSDTLLIFLLKAHRPDKYADRLNVLHTIRREAERIAAETGEPFDTLLAEMERLAGVHH